MQENYKIKLKFFQYLYFIDEMSKRKSPRTIIRALKFLENNPRTNSLSIHEASKSRASPNYIPRTLVQKGFATKDNGKYTITKQGLEELGRVTTISYEREQWEF